MRDQSNKLTELGKFTNNNVYSLAGFPTGVYALDVIIDNRAYETILVILPPNQLIDDDDDDSDKRKKCKPGEYWDPEMKKCIEIVYCLDGGKPVDGVCPPWPPGPIIPIFAPDKECSFNPDLPKCIPPEGQSCPVGFGTNEDGHCFPEGACDDGFARADDDETGRCIPVEDLKDCPGGEKIPKDWECPITIPRDEFGNPKCDELRGSTDPEVVDFCDDVWDDTFSEGVPVCDNVTVQRCQVKLPDGTWHVCEINTTDHECEVEEEPQPITPEPVPEPEMRLCTQGMDAGSLACKEGKTVEEFCKDNPSTQGCPGSEEPIIEPEPTPLQDDVCMGLPPEECARLPGGPDGNPLSPDQCPGEDFPGCDQVEPPPEDSDDVTEQEEVEEQENDEFEDDEQGGGADESSSDDSGSGAEESDSGDSSSDGGGGSEEAGG